MVWFAFYFPAWLTFKVHWTKVLAFKMKNNEKDPGLMVFDMFAFSFPSYITVYFCMFLWKVSLGWFSPRRILSLPLLWGYLSVPIPSNHMDRCELKAPRKGRGRNQRSTTENTHPLHSLSPKKARADFFKKARADFFKGLYQTGWSNLTTDSSRDAIVKWNSLRLRRTSGWTNRYRAGLCRTQGG